MAKADERYRQHLAGQLRFELEQSIDARIDRFAEIEHMPIIPAHYFAAASSECLRLYRDGYFLSAVMVSQAVNEGIGKLILERNRISRKGSLSRQVETLADQGLVSRACAEAFGRIWSSFRNDLHHMNPKAGTLEFEPLARRNLLDLTLIEKHVFETMLVGRTLVPVNPQYWDQSDGATPVFVR